jgi:WD40 repeat protein
MTLFSASAASADRDLRQTFRVYDSRSSSSLPFAQSHRRLLLPKMPGEPALKRPRLKGMPVAVAAAPAAVEGTSAPVELPKSCGDSALSIHKCAFIPVPAAGITALASSPDGSLAALARSGGSLELLSSLGPTGSRWTLCSALAAPPLSASPADISSLAFQSLPHTSLWVARMDGTVALLPISQDGLPPVSDSASALSLGGGAVWALAPNPTDPNTVAAACDDGSVRIVEEDPEGGGLAVVRVCGKTDARVLCVDWSRRAGIVCGDSAGGVRWVNPATGRVIGRGVLRGRRVWDLCFAKAGKEVVCGDSRGRVSVWDSATCTVSEELLVDGMNGDVLSVVSSLSVDAGETVLLGSASGAVGGIMAAPNAQPGDPWAPLRARRLHTHDVRALTLLGSTTGTDSRNRGHHLRADAGPSFLSGGLDATMCAFHLSTLLKDSQPSRVRPLDACGGPAAQPAVQFVARQAALVARYSDHVDVWRLFPRDRSPALLFRISVAASLGPTICAVAVSSSIRLVAISSASSARIYSIVPADKKKPLRNRTLESSNDVVPFSGKIRSALAASDPILAALVGSPDMVFAGKDPVLIAISRDRQSIVACSGLQAPLDVEQSDDDVGVAATRWGMFEHLGCARGTNRIVRLASSPATASRFAVSDSSGLVSVIDVGDDGGEDGQCAPVPVASHRVSSPVVAMGFSPDGSRLAITCTSGSIFVLTVQCKTLWTLRHVPAKVASLATCVSFSPSGKAIVLSGSNKCFIATVDVPSIPVGSASHFSKAAVTGESSPGLHDLGRHENVIATCVLGKDRLAIVYRPWDLVSKSLPSAIPRKVFGA